MRLTFFRKTKRSTQGFERRIEATQIRQIITDNVAKQQKSGLLARIFGLGRKQ